MKKTVVIKPTKCGECGQEKEPGSRMKVNEYEDFYMCEDCELEQSGYIGTEI